MPRVQRAYEPIFVAPFTAFSGRAPSTKQPLHTKHTHDLNSKKRGAIAVRSSQHSAQMFDLKGRPTGELSFEYVQGKTVATTSYARYPLKLISATRASDAGCAWVYTLGYGGGAVCGDEVTIRCSVGEECTAALTTQGSTKVYKRGSKGRDSAAAVLEVDARCASQSLRALVSMGGLLAVVPGPVTCFKDSSFRQHQRFSLERGASLVLVDWLTSGRMSRGEGWEFSRLESRNEVMVQASATGSGRECCWKPLVLDSLVLEELPGLSVRERMLGMNVVGVVILLGPRVQDLVSALLEQEARKRSRFPPGLEQSSKRPQTVGPETEGKLLFSVSPLRAGGCGSWCQGLVYRFAAERTEDARTTLHGLLLPLREALGGREPYRREGGTC